MGCSVLEELMLADYASGAIISDKQYIDALRREWPDNRTVVERSRWLESAMRSNGLEKDDFEAEGIRKRLVLLMTLDDLEHMAD